MSEQTKLHDSWEKKYPGDEHYFLVKLGASEFQQEAIGALEVLSDDTFDQYRQLDHPIIIGIKKAIEIIKNLTAPDGEEK